MPVAKMLELSSESTESFEDAVKQGIQRAHESIQNIRSAWVKDQEVLCKNGSITHYRVHLKVTFVLND